MSETSKHHSRQIQRTCSWILEAILILMKEKPYSKITVSEIINKAGIARQTFYRYYKDKDDVLLQYFSNIFNTEMLSIENTSENNAQGGIVLTFNIKYMVEQCTNFKKILSAVGIEYLFLDKFKEWQNLLADQNKDSDNSADSFVYRYKIFYQITGILRVIADWFENDMPLSVDELVELLNYFTFDTRKRYANIPNIIIRIIDK